MENLQTRPTSEGVGKTENSTHDDAPEVDPDKDDNGEVEDDMSSSNDKVSESTIRSGIEDDEVSKDDEQALDNCFKTVTPSSEARPELPSKSQWN